MAALGRRVGYNIKEAVMTAYNGDLEGFAKDIELSIDEVKRLFFGRLILSYDKMQRVSLLTVVSVKELLETNKKYSFVNDDFSNENSQDIVLDIIDDYLDILETVS